MSLPKLAVSFPQSRTGRFSFRPVGRPRGQHVMHSKECCSQLQWRVLEEDAMAISHKAEKAGESTAECAKEKTGRIRTRVATDEDLRRKLIIGGISALVAAAVGVGGYFIFKRREDIKKSLKDARDTIKEKIEHHGGSKPAAGAAS